MNFEVLALPALAVASMFGLVLAMPRRSPAHRIVSDIEGRARGAQAITERVVDAKDLGKLRSSFLQAGWYEATPTGLLARSGIFAGVALLAAIGLILLLHPNALFSGGIVLAFLAGGAHLPFSQLSGAVKKRKRAISAALPDLLDSLASTVRAGLAMNAALVHSANAVTGPLSEELKGTLSEIRHGRSRIDALRALADRVQNDEVTQVVRAMVQAERLGANLSGVLSGLADEARERRVLKAEEIAASLPVKMVLPMAAFMLPALFVMIFGAVAADYYTR